MNLYESVNIVFQHFKSYQQYMLKNVLIFRLMGIILLLILVYCPYTV